MPRGSGSLVAVLALALAPGVACSPFDAAATDGGPADGSVVVVGSSPDASSPDASSPDAPAPAIASCQSAPTGAVFCEDFEADKAHFGFTDDYGSEVTTTTRVAMAGRGHVLSYRSATTSATPSAWLRYGPGAPTSALDFAMLELTMDIAIVSQSADLGIVGGLWTLDASGAPEVHGIESTSHGTELSAWMAGNAATPRMVNLSEWHNVSLLLERAGSPTAFRRIVSVDGTPVDNTLITVAAATWDMRVGFYLGGLGTAELLLDNVVVTRR